MLTKHVLYQLSHSSDSLVIIAEHNRFVNPFLKKSDKYFLFFFNLGDFRFFFDLLVMFFRNQHIN